MGALLAFSSLATGLPVARTFPPSPKRPAAWPPCLPCSLPRRSQCWGSQMLTLPAHQATCNCTVTVNHASRNCGVHCQPNPLSYECNMIRRMKLSLNGCLKGTMPSLSNGHTCLKPLTWSRSALLEWLCVQNFGVLRKPPSPTPAHDRKSLRWSGHRPRSRLKRPCFGIFLFVATHALHHWQAVKYRQLNATSGPVVHRRQTAKAFLTSSVPNLKLHLLRCCAHVHTTVLLKPVYILAHTWRPFDSIVFVLKAAPTVVAWALKQNVNRQISNAELRKEEREGRTLKIWHAKQHCFLVGELQFLLRTCCVRI